MANIYFNINYLLANQNVLAKQDSETENQSNLIKRRMSRMPWEVILLRSKRDSGQQVSVRPGGHYIKKQKLPAVNS